MNNKFFAFFLIAIVAFFSSCQKEAPEPSKEAIDLGHEQWDRVEFIFTQGKVQFDNSEQPYFVAENQGIPSLIKQSIVFRNTETGVVSSGNTIRLQANADYSFEAIYYNTRGERMNHEFVTSEMVKIHQNFFTIPKKFIAEGVPETQEVFDFFYADTNPENGGFYSPENPSISLRKRIWDKANPTAQDPIGLKGFFRVKQADLSFDLRVTLAHFLTGNKLNPKTNLPYKFYEIPSLNFFAMDFRQLIPINIYADLNDKENNPNKYDEDLKKVLTNIEKELANLKKDLEEIKKLLLKGAGNNSSDNHGDDHDDDHHNHDDDNSTSTPNDENQEEEITGERIELIFNEGHTHSRNPLTNPNLELHTNPDFLGVKYFKSVQKVVFKKQGSKWVSNLNGKPIYWSYSNLNKKDPSPSLYGLQIIYYNSQNERINMQYAPEGKSNYQHFLSVENITAIKGETPAQNITDLLDFRYRDTSPESGFIKDRKGTKLRDEADPVGLKGIFVVKKNYQKFDLKISLFHFNNKPSKPLAFHQKPNSGGHTDIVLNVPIFIFGDSSSNSYKQDAADAYGVSLEEIEEDEDRRLEADVDMESGFYM